MSSILNLLNQAREILKLAGINSYNLDAEIILFNLLDIDKVFYINNPHEIVSRENILKYQELIEERLKHKPVSKITGKKEFYSLEFKVNENVLDPRPDSEVLIDLVRDNFDVNSKLKILDIGTGSGCLLITLLKYFSISHGTAVDISDKALEIARENAKNHQLLDRVSFVKSNIFENITQKYDLIISNPPYIKSNIIPDLEREVKEYDPLISLDGGGDGLNFYRSIAKEARPYLNNNGKIILEIGYDQKLETIDIFSNEGLDLIESRKDLSQNDRVLCFSR